MGNSHAFSTIYTKRRREVGLKRQVFQMFLAKIRYSADQRIKSFRVARRRESSVGLRSIGAHRRGYGIFRWSAGRRDRWPGRNDGKGGLWGGFRRDTGWKWEVGGGHECGAGSRRVKLEQRKAVACGARAVGGYGRGVGRGGSRSHRVSRREPANEQQVADMATRADGRLWGCGVRGVVIG